MTTRRTVSDAAKRRANSGASNVGANGAGGAGGISARDGGEVASIAIERDRPAVAARVSEAQFADELADMRQLQRISSQLIHEGNLDLLYGQLLDAVITVMRADMGSMQRLYPSENALRLLVWKGFDPAAAEFWEWVRVDSGSTCGVALSTHTRVIVADVETCDFMVGTDDLEYYRLSGIRAVQSTPLVSRSGRLLGMISTHWRTQHQPAERDLQLLDVLVRQAADLIERKQAEDATAHLAAIVTSSSDAIASKTLDGIITSWNVSAERMFGYSAREIIGQSVLLLIPDDRRSEEDQILARIKAGERIEHFETVRVTKDGRLLDVSLTISPIRDGAGVIIGASKIVRDITERKQAEATLRASEDRLRAEAVAHARQLDAIFDATADGMVIYDNAGSLIRWNAALANLFEFDQMSDYTSLPVGTRPTLLRVRDEHNQPMAAEQLPFMRAVRGETLTGSHAVDLTVTTPSGAVKYVSASAAPLRDDTGRTIGSVTVYRDVTERRRLEYTARATAERLQLALDASSSGTFVWYPAEDRGEPDTQMLRLFGLAPDDTLNLGPAFATMIHVDDRARYAASVARATDPDGSGELREDIRVMLPDGSERWLTITAQVSFERKQGAARRAIRMAGAATDVTDRKRLEERTHEALEALLEMANAVVGVPEGVATNEAATMRQVVGQVVTLVQRILGGSYTSIVLENEQTQAIEPLAVVGLSPEYEANWWANVTKARLEDYMASADATRLRAGEDVIIADVTEHPPVPGQDYWNIQTNLVMPVQIKRRLLVLTVGVRDRSTFTPQEVDLARAAARLSALVVERERLQRERTEADAKALAARETNERMHTFVGIAGHELRTPVTSLQANVQLAERAVRASLTADLPLDAGAKLKRAHGLLERADRQIIRLSRLIEDLLDVSRFASGTLDLRLATDDLGDITHEVVEALRLAWPSRTIALDLPDAPLTLRLDADRVGQVVTNYLTNALKYSAEDRAVAVTITTDAKCARVAVRDQGPGLSTEQQAHLWERFYQVESIPQQSGSGVGLGLGLYISRTIIERHGGEVGVESAPGEGSTFWFTLPLITPLTTEHHA